MKKFTMELVWHNCLECPPSESFNDNLYVTDGKRVRKGMYEAGKGWVLSTPLSHTVLPIPVESFKNFWWADIEQTVQGERGFKI